ncbi:unnamed protein product [Peniophora sp. CBMAI 1063]|nr:unnamed protein product [Peniophora sp. CBMAI 1063]
MAPLLLTLPKELWQNVAIEVVTAVLRTEDEANHHLPFPASLLPPLQNPGTSGYAGSIGRDPIPPLLARWDPSLPALACTSRDGRLSRQTQHCSLRHPPHIRSSILALLAICRVLRGHLIGLQPFWAKIALLFPPFLPDSLNWAGSGLEHPFRLETSYGLCSCVLPMLLTRVTRATHIRIALPRAPFGEQYPCDQIFDLLRNSSSRRLRHLELRHDSPHATPSTSPHTPQSLELPFLQSYIGVNILRIAHGESLRRLNIASECDDVALPVDFFLGALGQCPRLEELSVQTALRDAVEDVDAQSPLISLLYLRYFLLCDYLERWRLIRSRIDIPDDASIHADIVLDHLSQRLGRFKDFAAAAARYCLPAQMSCRVVLVEYHQVRKERSGYDHVVPQFVSFVFADTEDAVWAERDPSRWTARDSLTLRFQGEALGRRYPAEEWENAGRARDPPQTNALFHELLSGIEYALQLRDQPHLNFEVTKTFIEKAGGRARHISSCREIAETFPNLRSLVIYGVTGDSFHIVSDLISELAFARSPWYNLKQVRLPDWEWGASLWEAWNARIRRNVTREGKEDIEWLAS